MHIYFRNKILMYENNIGSVAVVRRIIIGSHPIEITAKNIMCQVEILDCL